MTTSCQNVENNTNQMQAHQLIYHIVPSKHPYPRKGPPPVLWFSRFSVESPTMLNSCVVNLKVRRPTE